MPKICEEKVAEQFDVQEKELVSQYSFLGHVLAKRSAQGLKNGAHCQWRALGCKRMGRLSHRVGRGRFLYISFEGGYSYARKSLDILAAATAFVPSHVESPSIFV